MRAADGGRARQQSWTAHIRNWGWAREEDHAGQYHLAGKLRQQKTGNLYKEK